MTTPPITVSAIATTLNCLEGLRELLGDLSRRNPSLRVFREKGANISRGRNVAVEESKGNVIVSFDSGRRMGENYVRCLMAPFFSNSECGVTGAHTIAFGETPFEECLAKFSMGTKKDMFNPSSRGIAFHRDVFEAIGGYDESVLAGEDSHFNLKWCRAGTRTAIPQRQPIGYNAEMPEPATYIGTRRKEPCLSSRNRNGLIRLVW